MAFSLMNGLSQMGTGVAAFAATAGLEAQKADLARQTTILADQLATTRESAGRQEAGKIAATAADIQNTFMSGENALNRTTQLSAATIAANATTGAASIHANADPDAVKVARAFYALPGQTPPVAPTASGGASATPQAPVQTPTWPGAITTNDPSPVPVPANVTVGPSASTPYDPMKNPLVQKFLGIPMDGSDAANRAAIMREVAADPKFKDLTPGQRVTEMETQYLIATGKLASPEIRKVIATAVASYQLSPLEERARQSPGGPETMALVLRLNPDYQEAQYKVVSDVMKRFGAEKEGDTVRALDVGVQHLATIDQAAIALKNGDIRALNSLKSAFQSQFGVSAPITFDALKQIVATEVLKATSGGIGGVEDRDAVKKSLDRANSLEVLREVTQGFRSLMAGQLDGLRRQYETGTGFKDGSPFAFNARLAPATIEALQGRDNAPPIIPTDPAARVMDKAYPLPNGKTGIWRGTGWEVQ